jgi:phenylalanyl-tRNA synthetase beta chain
MASIKIEHDDLNQLVGKKLTVEQLEKIFPNVKCEFDKVENGEIDLEVTHERPDMLTTAGISRAIRGHLGIETGVKRYRLNPSNLRVVIDKTPESRPVIRCCVVKNVELSHALVKQLMQIQEKLHLIYARKRKKCAIGIHDYDTVKGPFRYNDEPPGKIKFVPLGESHEMDGNELLTKTGKGREYAHLLKGCRRYPCLRDDDGVILAVPPVLNGAHTMVTGDTRNLFIDMTGPSERVADLCMAVLATSLAERGAELQSVEVVCRNRKLTTPVLGYNKRGVSPERINRLLGTAFKPEEMVNLLRKARFDAEYRNKEIYVTAPCYRFDLMHDVDVAEEVAVQYGYNAFEPKLPNISTVGRKDEIEKISEDAREIMVGLGFQEVLTYILCSKALVTEKVNSNDAVIEIDTPVSEEYAVVRNSLLPRLLDVLAENRHHELPQKIFEADDMVRVRKKDAVTERRLCAMEIGSELTFTGIKSVLDSLMRNLGTAYQLKESRNPTFLDGRVAGIMVKGREIGVIGELHPEVLNNFSLEYPVAAFELDLESLLPL